MEVTKRSLVTVIVIILFQNLVRVIGDDSQWLCRCPSPPSNGYTYGCTGNGSIVEYYCNSGYHIVGNGTRLCYSRGIWEGSAPTCRKMSSTEQKSGNLDLNIGISTGIAVVVVIFPGCCTLNVLLLLVAYCMHIRKRNRQLQASLQTTLQMSPVTNITQEDMGSDHEGTDDVLNNIFACTQPCTSGPNSEFSSCTAVDENPSI